MQERTSELSGRKAAILRALVKHYIRTGEPVGSEMLAQASGLHVSSATIRTELAALAALPCTRQGLLDRVLRRGPAAARERHAGHEPGVVGVEELANVVLVQPAPLLASCRR